MTKPNCAALAGWQRIGKSQLNKRLTSHADSLGFPVYGMQQVNGEIHIHTLNLTAGASSLREIEIRGKIFSRIVHLIQTCCGQPLSLQNRLLLIPPARGGPR